MSNQEQLGSLFLLNLKYNCVYYILVKLLSIVSNAMFLDLTEDSTVDL